MKHPFRLYQQGIGRAARYVTIIMFPALLSLFLLGCAARAKNEERNGGTIQDGILRQTVYALVSSAENSSLDYSAQYAYIEGIGDGRGYTAGIIGFTSETGDLLEVAERYVTLRPEDNAAEPYLPALRAAVGSDTHEGLGRAFEQAWRDAASDAVMVEAQDAVVDEVYLLPAVTSAETDGLSVLGQYIYYDAMVVHGPGEDIESFGGIRNAALAFCAPPSRGGDETVYLSAFLDARSAVMLMEEAHSDLSRIEAQRGFLADGNFELSLPLRWTMYGDSFELTEQVLADLSSVE